MNNSDRYFPATVLGGRLHVRGLPDWGPWNPARLEWADEEFVDMLLTKDPVHRKARSHEELEAVMKEPRGVSPTREVWVHGCLLVPSFMSRSFTGARLKIRRAYEHLSIYEDQVRRFYKTKPNRVSFHLNRKRTEGRFNVAIRKPLPQDDWGPIIGDCVHNARAALDHLVWELSEKFCGPDPTDRDTQFPIYDALHATMSFTDRAGRRIKRLPIYAQALVEQLQPYHASRPMEHPLCLCRDFDDTDKHKLIPVIIAAVQFPGASWTGGDLRIVESRFTNGPFENGAKVGFVKCATPVAPGVKVQPNFGIVEALSDSPPYIDSRHTLQRILHHVTRVIDAFDNFPNHQSFLQIPTP